MAIFTCNSGMAEVYSFYTDQVRSNAFLSVARARIALGYRAISLSSTTNSVSSVWLRDYVPAELSAFIPYEAGHGMNRVVEIINFNGDGLVHRVELSPIESRAYYQLGISFRAKPFAPGFSRLKAPLDGDQSATTSPQTRNGPRLNLSLIPKTDLFSVR